MHPEGLTFYTKKAELISFCFLSVYFFQQHFCVTTNKLNYKNELACEFALPKLIEIIRHIQFKSSIEIILPCFADTICFIENIKYTLKIFF